MDTALHAGPAPDAAPLPAETVEALTQEALNPATTPDFFDLVGRKETVRVPIAFMPIEAEREVLRLLGPFLPKLTGLDTKEPDLQAMLGLADEAVDVLLRAAVLITDGEPDEEWLKKNCSAVVLVRLCLAQLAKYGLQESLGKLLPGGGLPSQTAPGTTPQES